MIDINTNTLLNIGIALSREKDFNKLLEIILDAAMDITNCDGGTLYVVEDEKLVFKLFINKSLGTREGFDGEPINLPPIPINAPNDCARAAAGKIPINVTHKNDDTNGNDGTKKYDDINKYKTISTLSIPMENDKGDIIGVLQLINAKNDDGGFIPFDAGYEAIVLSLASQCAISLTNHKYAAEVTALLDSFVRVMSAAIDERSQYNANHTRNMVLYAQRFSTWLDESSIIHFDPIRQKQLLMSAWLHDIGKLVVPLEIMDKETRLGHKIKDIRNRYLLFDMQNKINHLSGQIDLQTFDERAAGVSHARELVETANRAGFLTDEMLDALHALSLLTAHGPNGVERFLEPDELICLQIRKGTLTDEERRIMEGHVMMTRRLLSEMDFPKHYNQVPHWASFHHEFLNGKGYPDGLEADMIPLEVRMLTIIDIYDALTACDRPYKQAMPTEKAFFVLEDMAKLGQLDPTIVGLFKESKAWENDSYA